MLVAAALLLAADGTAALLPRGWSALCPPKTRSDEIVVCTNRDPPPSPYRAPIAIPREFGDRGTASVSAERNRLLGPDAGFVGTCSGIGPSGPFGCKYKEFKNNVNQAAGSRDTRGRVYDRTPE
ncbi:hypothetical protein [Sandarakinorhabdus sp.]|uniref:hypothetical protein n=1 Tax=Sandarakinorhabdus sp. TaxID=1916663 RepID=UPI003F72FF85